MIRLFLFLSILFSLDGLFSVLVATLQETFIDQVCSRLAPNSSLDVINNTLVLITTLLTKESGKGGHTLGILLMSYCLFRSPPPPPPPPDSVSENLFFRLTICVCGRVVMLLD